MKRFLFIAVPVLLLCLASTGRANPIVYNNGSPDLSIGYFFGNGSAELILDFSIAQPTQLTGVNFWTLGAPGNTYWAVYADNSGAPLWGGTPLFSGTTAAVSTDLGDPVDGLDPFHNFINISAFLGSGTYWLGLGASNSSYWAPSTSGTIGQWSWIHQLTTQFDYSSGYISFPEYHQEYAFNIEGSVPEPATMLLLGSGLIGLAGYGRKKFFKK